MLKKMLSDRRGVAIELAILMTAVCMAVTTIVLSMALLQYEHKVRAEQQMEENVIFEQIVEEWVGNISKNITEEIVCHEDKGYRGVVSTTASGRIELEIIKIDASENRTKVLTVTAEKKGEEYIITEWTKG